MKALRAVAKDRPAQLVEMSSSELTPGEVHVQIHWSSLNYKDALAVTARGKILRNFPLNPGIDFSGKVIKSSDSNFKPGDSVLVTGCSVGEEFDGGFAEEVKVRSSSVIPLPTGMSLEESMFFGTAGFTAALAVHRLLENDQCPTKGPILVSGATGGVGSFSIALLSHLGFEVIALTGKKKEREDDLKSLGASQVMEISDLNLGERPLEKALFGGVIDNLGGEFLSKALPHVGLWGNVASIGLAQGLAIQTTVMPFILRGVSLLGVSSNNCPLKLRRELWSRLTHEWKTPSFEKIETQQISLEKVPQMAEQMLARKTHGRILVKLVDP